MTFKPGDVVKIVGGCACSNCKTRSPDELKLSGEISVVSSVALPMPFLSMSHGMPSDSRWHMLDMRGPTGNPIAAIPAWLEKHWDGKEAGEWSTELLNLCGIGSKAKEEA